MQIVSGSRRIGRAGRRPRLRLATARAAADQGQARPVLRNRPAQDRATAACRSTAPTPAASRFEAIAEQLDPRARLDARTPTPTSSTTTTSRSRRPRTRSALCSREPDEVVLLGAQGRARRPARPARWLRPARGSQTHAERLPAAPGRARTGHSAWYRLVPRADIENALERRRPIRARSSRGLTPIARFEPAASAVEFPPWHGYARHRGRR